MSADEQTLKIQVIDHRVQGDPAKNVEVFSDHRSYLNRVKKLVQEVGRVREETWTRISIYPRNQGDFFSDNS
jgi:hypothetical protein